MITTPCLELRKTVLNKWFYQSNILLKDTNFLKKRLNLFICICIPEYEHMHTCMPECMCMSMCVQVSSEARGSCRELPDMGTWNRTHIFQKSSMCS